MLQVRDLMLRIYQNRPNIRHNDVAPPPADDPSGTVGGAVNPQPTGEKLVAFERRARMTVASWTEKMKDVEFASAMGFGVADLGASNLAIYSGLSPQPVVTFIDTSSWRLSTVPCQQMKQSCRNMIKKPWVLIRVPHMNPNILGVIGPWFLNQVPTLYSRFRDDAGRLRFLGLS